MRHETTVFIWDLDKTYLVSHFESLRQLLRVPFEKGQDKVAVPGAVPLIRALRRSLRRRGWPVRIYFVSASPPQIAGAIREKLALDGIDYDGIAFKNQMRHLMSARFSAVREHIGYKLEQLLRDAREMEAQSRLIFFGDDWESDPLIYSLFADIIEGRLEPERVVELLEAADVDEHYLSRVRQLLAADLPRLEVRRIFILRQRPVDGSELDAFGERMTWVDDYFEAALRLYAMGCLDVAGVLDVAFDVRRPPALLAETFDEFERRGAVDRAALAPALRALVRSGLMPHVSAGPLWRRVWAARRRRFGSWSKRRQSPRGLDYRTLIERWSYRGRKEAVQANERNESGDRRVDDGSR